MSSNPSPSAKRGSRAATPNATKMSWKDLEAMVKDHQVVLTEQHTLIQSLLSRLATAESTLTTSTAKIRSLQHGLAIANLRGNTTIFHMQSFLAHKAAITCSAWLGGTFVLLAATATLKTFYERSFHFGTTASTPLNSSFFPPQFF